MDKIHLSLLDVFLLKTSKIIKIKNRKRLSKHGLIIPAYKTDSLSEKPKWYKISEKGIDYLLYRKEQMRKYVSIPIIVSLLTNLILRLLPVLSEWIELLQE